MTEKLSKAVRIWLTPSMLDRVRVLASDRGLGVSAMLRLLIGEGLRKFT